MVYWFSQVFMHFILILVILHNNFYFVVRNYLRLFFDKLIIVKL